MIDNIPIAAMFLILFNKTIEYIVPVIKVAYRNRQPLSFLIWHGMKYGIENHYSLWNWGGTHHDQQSLFHFKDGFGSQNRTYMYLIHAKEHNQAKIDTLLKEIKDDFPYYYLFPFKKN